MLITHTRSASMMKLMRIDSDEYLDLRHAVLWPEGTREAVMVEGDDLAEHYGLYDNQTLISCLSVFYPSAQQCQIRKFATLQAYQGKGHGSALMRSVLDTLRATGIQHCWLDARITATAFYQRHGFVAEGTPFLRKNVTFIKMSLTLP